jgi:hypothetical protein
MVDSVNGIPTAFAALAALTSPRLEYIPAIPTGPRTTGSDITWSHRGIDKLSCDSSIITRWRNSVVCSSAIFARSVFSWKEPPLM